MKTEKLSSIENTHSTLYASILKLRDLLFNPLSVKGQPSSININFEKISQLIKSEENKNGGFYKYYYDFVIDTRSWEDPAGNNLLLLAIAKASDLNSSSPDKIQSIKIINLILDDAKTKLNPDELKDFVDFRFTRPNEEDPQGYYYYDNTPLTLAIKVGCINEAKKIIEYGTNVNQACDLYGKFTPLHLAIFRLFFSNDTQEAIELIKSLIQKGANPDQCDVSGKTPREYLLQEKFCEILHIENTPRFSILSQELKKQIQKSDNKKLSFLEIINNPEIIKFFEEKNINNFCFNNIKELIEFANNTRDAKGNKYILFYQRLDIGSITDLICRVFDHYDKDVSSSSDKFKYLKLSAYGEYYDSSCNIITTIENSSNDNCPIEAFYQNNPELFPELLGSNLE
jgi:ankyrin repeat protein